MLSAIGGALGVPEFAGPNLFEIICAKVGGAPALLTLDNLEHVIRAGRDLIRLLERCTNLKILATSRTPLRLPEELVVPISPLPTPDLARSTTVAELGTNEAVALFVQRVQEFDPEFALSETNTADIAKICVHLDGLPLAIALAATRLRVLSPAALKTRLSDSLAILRSDDTQLPQDHRSLRAAIASSVELLSPESRILFRRLAVFANGCDAPAVEAVCANGLATASRSCEVLDAISELLEHGLLHRAMVADEPRFIMPETICEFALEQLEAAGESDRIHHRHAAYFMTMAEEAAPSLVGELQQAWFARLSTKLDNIRAGLRWSLVHEPALALRTTTALWRFWYAKGQLREGTYWLDRALCAAPEDRSVHRVRALNGYGVLIRISGDSEHARRLQEESLALARELGDAWGSAVAQADLAIIDFELNGDAERLVKETQEAIAAFRELGDRHLESVGLNTLGDVALIQGDIAGAAHHFEEALAIARETGDVTIQALALFNLARLARREVGLERAEHHHVEALALSARIGRQEEILYNLAGLAGLAADRSDFERAAELLRAAAQVSEATGIVLQQVEQSQFERDAARVRQALPNEAFVAAWNTGWSRSLQDLVTLGTDGLPASASLAVQGLSPREIEVLRLLANGFSDREIANALFISSDTASTHVKNIRRKLGVHTRAAAAAYAIRHNLI